MSHSQFTWIGRKTFQVDGVRFTYAVPIEKDVTEEERDALVIFKDRIFVEDYMRVLASERIRNVLEFGIYAGGSIVLWQKLWNLDKIVGVDIAKSKPNLVERVAALGLADRIKLRFGVDQADASAVQGILDTEFGGQPLDLIIDDASHDLVPTTKSLLSSFPRLRPGGWYVVEDWNWEFRRAFEKNQDKVGLLPLVDTIARAVGEYTQAAITQVVVTRRLLAFQKSMAPDAGPLPVWSLVPRNNP